MKHKSKKETWKNPTQSFIEQVDRIVKSGITSADKKILMDELDEMVDLLKEWKVNNSKTKRPNIF